MPEFAAVVRAVRDDHDAGVLLIDHNMALIMEVCDRIQVLDQGRTLAEGTPAEIRGEPRRRRRLPRRERRAGGRADDVTPLLERRRRSRSATAPSPPCAASRSTSATGEIVGLIGPNGAGKSTTLHAIMGVVAVARGRDPARAARSLRGRRPRRSRAPASRSCPRGGGSSPSSPSRRTSASASPGGARASGRRGDIEQVYELFPSSREFRAPAGGRALGRPAAAARDRPRARRPADVLLLDEPSLGLAPKIVDVVFEALARDPRARRHASCSSSSARSARSRSPTGRTCSRTASCG